MKGITRPFSRKRFGEKGIVLTSYLSFSSRTLPVFRNIILSP